MATPRAHDERARADRSAALVRRERDRSAAAAASRTSTQQTACAASVWSTARGARSCTISAIASSGWMVPISLFTSMTDTRATSSIERARQAHRDRRHRGRRRARCARRAGRRGGGRRGARSRCTPPSPSRAPSTPATARLSASVPPLVNTTSPGWQPTTLGQLARGRRPARSGRGARQRVGAGRVADPVAAAPGPWPRAPRAAVGSWRRGRGSASARASQLGVASSAEDTSGRSVGAGGGGGGGGRWRRRRRRRRCRRRRGQGPRRGRRRAAAPVGRGQRPPASLVGGGDAHQEQLGVHAGRGLMVHRRRDGRREPQRHRVAGLRARARGRAPGTTGPRRTARR